MNRLEAICLIINQVSENEAIIHANGAISRESFYCKKREKNFYLLGSMGLASSVGLGIALNKPKEKVIVLDGDGNVLMGLGNLAMIGAMKPRNLIHIILDNEVYGTTGNQPTISPKINLSEIARVCGYCTSHLVRTGIEFIEIYQIVSNQSGPHFIQFKVNKYTPQTCPRIPHSAEQIKEIFMDCRI